MNTIPDELKKGDIFRSAVVNAINALIRWANSLRITAGHGIAIDRTPAGIVIKATATPSATAQSIGGGYNGYFKVLPVSGGVVKICNGAAPSNPIAGYTDFYSGAVLTSSLTFSSTGAVYLKGWYDSNASAYSTAVVSSSSNISFINGSEGYFKLADVTVTSGGVQVAQVWTGGNIYFGTRYLI